MQSFAVCHESSLHFSEKTMRGEKTKTPVDQVAVHPYHPDTPTFRYTLARYFDRMRLVDEQMGELLNKLKADGLIEDTFVFYFGDHGGVLPRGKGYAYESGLHVPLVVRLVLRVVAHIIEQLRELIQLLLPRLRLATLELGRHLSGLFGLWRRRRRLLGLWWRWWLLGLWWRRWLRWRRL